MISAESLSAVIGSLTQADAGVAGVDGISADSYTGQAQAVVSAVSGQLASAQASLNDTASQLNQAAAGLNSGAETLKTKSSDMSNGASQMSAGAKQMEAGVSSIPEVPSDPTIR